MKTTDKQEHWIDTRNRKTTGPK